MSVKWKEQMISGLSGNRIIYSCVQSMAAMQIDARQFKTQIARTLRAILPCGANGTKCIVTFQLCGEQ